MVVNTDMPISGISKSTIQVMGSIILHAEICAKVHASLKHQLDYMAFYREDSENDPISEVTLKKLEEAPFKNSGCKSNFGQSVLKCRRGGVWTSLQIMSNRHMVKSNIGQFCTHSFNLTQPSPNS